MSAEKPLTPDEMRQRFAEMRDNKERRARDRQSRATEEIARELWLARVERERAAEAAVDPRTLRYRQAVAKLVAEGVEPTDEHVSEQLGRTARTLRQWRHDGLIS